MGSQMHMYDGFSNVCDSEVKLQIYMGIAMTTDFEWVPGIRNAVQTINTRNTHQHFPINDGM